MRHFARVFPFHFARDANALITESGAFLPKICSREVPGARLQVVLHAQSPEGELHRVFE